MFVYVYFEHILLITKLQCVCVFVCIDIYFKTVGGTVSVSVYVCSTQVSLHSYTR
jgi:hypothetical protein